MGGEGRRGGAKVSRGSVGELEKGRGGKGSGRDGGGMWGMRGRD